MFNTNLKTKINNSKNYKVVKEYLKPIEQEANELIDIPIKPIPFSIFKVYANTGNRLEFENLYFERRKYLVTFTIMSLIKGTQIYLDKLEDILWSICDEYSWALPPHMDGKSLTELKFDCIDLFSCETAFSLAEIINLLEDKLSNIVVKRIKYEILNRVLNPYINSNYQYNWEAGQNNWSAVCASSIGGAALYIIEDELLLNKFINRVTNVLKKYIDSFEEDGACLEGLSYWTYGLEYFTAFADLLLQKTNKINLFSIPKIKNIAEFNQKCYFSNSYTVSFSDSSNKDKFRIGLICYLSNYFENIKMPPYNCIMQYYSDNCYRFNPTIRDIAWATDFKNIISNSKNEYLPNAQWWIYERDNICFAVKGGNNGEPHNHNDVGTFIYYKNNECIFEDLGAGEYTQDYFSQNRYQIFCNSSFSHNVPIVNNQGQKEGINYKCTNCKYSQNKLILNISKAYDVDDLKSLKRTYYFDNNKLKIIDEFEFNNIDIIERFVTQIKPLIKNEFVLIENEKVSCKLYLNPKNCIPYIDEHIHYNHNGIPVKVYSINYKINTAKVCEFVIE